MILPLKAKDGNPAHLLENQMIENHDVTDEDLGLLTQEMSLFGDFQQDASLPYSYHAPLPCSYQIQVIHELHGKIPTYENHAYHSRPRLQFKELIGININFLESRMTCKIQYHLHALQLHAIIPCSIWPQLLY